MKKRTAIALRAGFVAGLAALCEGCPDPNIYGTPRTVPVGEVSHTFALQGAHYTVDYKQAGRVTSDDTGLLLPTYLLRVGVLDNMDVGLRVAQMSSIGLDVKWNFLKTGAFDMAIDPTFQAFHYANNSENPNDTYTELYSTAPFIFGINVADSVVIVPTAGILYGKSSATNTAAGTDESVASSIDGLMFRGGFGFDFRLTPKFGVHPELTYLRSLGSTPTPVSWLLFGVGFSFGSLPSMGSPGEPAH